MFYGKLFILIASLFFTANIIAATPIVCPTVAEIKRNDFRGWLPLYIENEELASETDTEQFKSAVTTFSAARWHADYLENGHCFYQGTHPIIDKIVFAHDAWQPSHNVHWQWTLPNQFAECHSETINNCEFMT